MKLLLDACLWGKCAAALRKHGHDVIWVGDWDFDPGDEAILAFGHQEERIIITADKDFGELAVLRQLPHQGIVRIVNFSARRQAEVCEAALAKYGAELLGGAIVTASPGRIRLRLP